MLLVFLKFNSFSTMIKYSIIICSYNRFELLVETIDSVLSVVQNRKDFEILIIDNKSTDLTPTLQEKFSSNKKVKYFLEPKQGLSHARNRGIVEAKGEILVYLDDDVELIKSYFDIADSILTDKSISIFGGKVLPFKTEIPKWLPSKYYHLVSIFDLGDNVQIVNTLMGANYAMTKKLASEVGFYNPELGRKGNNLMGGEENEYFNRVKKNGFKIIYNPKLIVLHKINSKLNKKYVLRYSKESGKSERIIDESISKVIVIKKTIKSYIAILLHHLLRGLIKQERKMMFIRIINEYAKGYISKH